MTPAAVKLACGCPRKFSNEPHNCGVCKAPIGDGWHMGNLELMRLIGHEVAEMHVCEPCRDDIKYGGHREIVPSSFMNACTVWVPGKVSICERCDAVGHVVEVGLSILCKRCAEPDENACVACKRQDGTHEENGRWICDDCVATQDDVQEGD